MRSETDISDTFRSRLPLTWPTGNTGPSLSHYVEAFGGAKIGADRARPNSALFRAKPVRYTDTTCPFGAVNPYTAAVPARGRGHVRGPAGLNPNAPRSCAQCRASASLSLNPAP